MFLAALAGCPAALRSWSPLSLSNLGLWLRASPADLFQDAGQTAPCSDGQSVYTWHDRSANGRHAVQATAANRPTLSAEGGRDWVKFLGDGGDAITSPWSPTSPNSEWFVRLKIGAARSYILSLGSAANAWGFIAGNDPYPIRAARLVSSGASNDTPTLTPGTPAVVHVRGAGNSAWSAAWAGFAAVDGGAPVATSTGYGESQGSTVITPNLDGITGALWVSDLIVTEGGLSSADRQRVFDWLAAN